MSGKTDLEIAPTGTGGGQMQNFAYKPSVIEIVEVIDGKSGFDEKGQRITTGVPRDVKKLRIATKIIGELIGSKGDKAGKKFPVRASEVFNMTLRDGKWMVPGHEKAGIQLFLKKFGVKHPDDLIGKEVMTILRKSKDGTRDFLGIAH